VPSAAQPAPNQQNRVPTQTVKAILSVIKCSLQTVSSDGPLMAATKTVKLYLDIETATNCHHEPSAE
jgi:hypothetical protein